MLEKERAIPVLSITPWQQNAEYYSVSDVSLMPISSKSALYL
jgi:hypothetical protein